MRQCIATGQSVPPENLIRFVAGPDGALVPDLAEKLPGRGAWLTASPEAVAAAVRKKAFARHLGVAEAKQVGRQMGGPETVSAQLSHQLAGLLADQFVQMLALSRRAGLAIGGSGSLREAGRIEGLLIADDASQREAAKLTSAVQPGWVIKGVPAGLLGQAFGRDSLAFAGMLASSHAGQVGLQQKLRASWQKLEAFIGVLSCQALPGQCITGPQAGQLQRQDRTAQEGAK